MALIVVLKSAQTDFNELRSDFKAHHTAAAHAQLIAAFRQLLAGLKTFPDSDLPVEAAREVAWMCGNAFAQRSASSTTMTARTASCTSACLCRPGATSSAT